MREARKLKGWHIPENRWKWRRSSGGARSWAGQELGVGAEVRTDAKRAHSGKVVGMERRQEEKRQNEGGQKENNFTKPSPEQLLPVMSG